MPRRQGNPIPLLFVFLLPFIITCIFKSKNTHSPSRKKAEKVDVPLPVKENLAKMPPQKDFLKMDDWNTIVNPEKNLKSKDFLLTPDPNNGHWYAFIVQP